MSAFLEATAAWLVDYFAAATVVLVAALALRLVLRQPAARMAVAWSACVGLLLLAVLTALPGWPRVGMDELPWPTLAAREAESPVAILTEPLPIESIESTVAQATPDIVWEHDLAAAVPGGPLASSPPLDGTQLAVALWLGGLALAVGWIAIGHWRAGRLVRAAVKAPAWAWDELRSIVERTPMKAASVPPSLRLSVVLLASRRINSAAALGAIVRKIILPEASLVESNRPAVRAALAHEWAHFRHGDLWLLALERLLLPLLVLHPLFWLLRRGVRLDQELLADAAAAGDEPAEYAEALLAWARTAQPARHGLAALSMWEHPSTLSRRVAMILDSKRRTSERLGRVWMAVMALCAVPAILALSLLSLRPTTAQDKPPEAQVERVAAPRLVAALEPEVAAGNTVPVTQVQLDLILFTVSREKLAAADTTLEDAIAQATDSRCRREAGLVVCDVSEAELGKLMDGLKKHEAFTLLSRPSVLTLDGREAVVHVGGEVPVLRVEETVNGAHERRVEYKDFGTMVMIRPKLKADGSAETIDLELVAEQANLLPPGEKVEEGAVPRDVPGLVNHKFKLATDAKVGGSLLVAESPADKKQLRAGTDQFVVVVSPKKVIRTTVAAYTDPRTGQQAEAAKIAAAAQEAATAAEPDAGTAAAALLAREREGRARETAQLKRQIDELSQEIAKLREATGHKLVSREIALKNQDPQVVAEALGQIIAKAPSKRHFAIEKVTVGPDRNTIVIQIEEKHIQDFEHAIQALDRPLDSTTPQNAYADAVRRVLESRKRAAAQPPGDETRRAANRSAPDPTQNPNLGELTADVAEARLELERAEKEYARVEQLRQRGAISDAQVDVMRFNLEKAKIQLQRAEARLHAPAPAAPAANTAADSDKVGKRTEVRLLELDLADAKLAIQEAETELQRAQELRERSPGGVSEQELRKYQFQAERAKIQMQRVMIRLEAAKEDEQARGR